MDKQFTWADIDKEVERAAVAPFLFHVLSDQKWGKIYLSPNKSAPILPILKKIYLESLVDTHRKLKIYREIVAAFREQGVEVIPLKGVHLSRFLYAAVELRPFSDMDLLVRQHQAGPALAALRQLGYTHGGTYYTLSRRVGDTAAAVDLHCDDTFRACDVRIDVAGIWAGAQQSPELPNEYLMDDRHTFLYLCWHTCNHVAGRKKIEVLRLVDLALLLERLVKNKSLVGLEAVAESWGVRRHVEYSLYLLEELVGYSTPGDLAIKPTNYPAIENILCGKVIKRMDYLGQTVMSAVFHDGAWNKLRYVFGRRYGVRYIGKRDLIGRIMNILCSSRLVNPLAIGYLLVRDVKWAVRDEFAK